MRTTLTYNFWSEQEIERLKQLIGTTTSFEEITKSFPGRTTKSLQKKAFKLGLKNPYYKKTYSHDSNFFQTPNLINSYWAGWICGRGVGYSNKNTIITTARPSDIDHLTQFKNAIQYTGPIAIYKYKRFQNEYTTDTPTMTLCGASQVIYDLKKHFGFNDSKLDKTAPTIDNLDLSLAFIAGLIDSDGYITLSSKSSIYYKGQISISVFNKELVFWVHNALNRILSENSLAQPKIEESGQNRFHLNYYATNAIYILKRISLLNIPVLKRNVYGFATI